MLILPVPNLQPRSLGLDSVPPGPGAVDHNTQQHCDSEELESNYTAIHVHPVCTRSTCAKGSAHWARIHHKVHHATALNVTMPVVEKATGLHSILTHHATE